MNITSRLSVAIKSDTSNISFKRAHHEKEMLTMQQMWLIYHDQVFEYQISLPLYELRQLTCNGNVTLTSPTVQIINLVNPFP